MHAAAAKTKTKKQAADTCREFLWCCFLEVSHLSICTEVRLRCRRTEAHPGRRPQSRERWTPRFLTCRRTCPEVRPSSSSPWSHRRDQLTCMTDISASQWKHTQVTLQSARTHTPLSFGQLAVFAVTHTLRDYGLHAWLPEHVLISLVVD